jgi:hypothetical protein
MRSRLNSPDGWTSLICPTSLMIPVNIPVLDAATQKSRIDPWLTRRRREAKKPAPRSILSWGNYPQYVGMPPARSVLQSSLSPGR